MGRPAPRGLRAGRPQHLAGLTISEAECSPGGAGWGISNDVWLGVLTGVTVVLVLCAEAAAIAVFARTRGANFGDGPPGDGRFGGRLPETRWHFFATASIVANAIFLLIVVLDGTASIADVACRQG